MKISISNLEKTNPIDSEEYIHVYLDDGTEIGQITLRWPHGHDFNEDTDVEVYNYEKNDESI